MSEMKIKNKETGAEILFKDDGEIVYIIDNKEYTLEEYRKILKDRKENKDNDGE